MGNKKKKPYAEVVRELVKKVKEEKRAQEEKEWAEQEAEYRAQLALTSR